MIRPRERVRTGVVHLLYRNMLVRSQVSRPVLPRLSQAVARPAAECKRRFSSMVKLAQENDGVTMTMDVPPELQANTIRNEATTETSQGWQAPAREILEVPMLPLKLAEDDMETLLDADFSQLQSLLSRKWEPVKGRKEVHAESAKSSGSSQNPFPTIPSLFNLIRTRQFEKAFRITENEFNKGNVLTPAQFEALIDELSDNKQVTYSMTKLYSQRYDVTAFHTGTIVLMLRAANVNDDPKMVRMLFETYMNVCEQLDPEILLMATRSYLSSGKVSMATQIFNQTVLMGTPMQAHVLKTYLKQIMQITRNVGLAYTAYRLWVSNNLETLPATDAMLYEALKKAAAEDKLAWLRTSLDKRDRLKDPEIVWAQELWPNLTESPEAYRQFFDQGDYTRWRQLLFGMGPEVSASHTPAPESYERTLSNFENRLFELSLKHRMYNRAKYFLMVRSQTRFVFLNRLDMLLRHLAERGEPQIIRMLLSCLHDHSGLPIHRTYCEVVPRALCKAYPGLTKYVVKKFSDLYMNQGTRAFWTVARRLMWLPTGGRPNKSTFKSINSKIRKGINPSQQDLTAALNRTNSVDKMNSLIDLAYHSSGTEIQIGDLGFQTALFWKRREMGDELPGSRSIRGYLKKVLVAFNQNRFTSVKQQDMVELVLMSTKPNNTDLGVEILQQMEKMFPHPVSEKDSQQLAYSTINLCFATGDYKTLLKVMEEVKAGECGVYPTFVRVLQELPERYLHRGLDETDVGRTLLLYYGEAMQRMQEALKDRLRAGNKEVSESLEWLSGWIREDFSKRAHRTGPAVKKGGKKKSPTCK